jgi:hypothetical protein
MRVSQLVISFFPILAIPLQNLPQENEPLLRIFLSAVIAVAYAKTFEICNKFSMLNVLNIF